MNRRQLLRSTPLALVSLAGCSLFGTAGGDQALQTIYQQAIAAEDAAAVLFTAGTALVEAGVIKTGSTAYADVDIAFQALAGAANSVNSDIQTGLASPIAGLLSAAMAALAAAQAALAKNKPTTAQSRTLQAMQPAVHANISFSVILQLVETFLPIIISAGGSIAQLIRNLIASWNAPKNGVTLTPADVQAANDAMNAALKAWNVA